MAATLYLDYNATAPLRPAAAKAVIAALAHTGNPSSLHRPGRLARRLLDDARECVAARAGASPAGVIFTSGGTEANNLALRGFPDRLVLASQVEHPSILKGPVDRLIPVDPDGIVDLAMLRRLLADLAVPALVAVMLANNETGVCQPIAAVAEIVHAAGGLLHCDAVQGLGKLDVDIRRLGADLISLSAHKIGGPQGVGALVLADPEIDIMAQLTGGGQERRRRAGTENVAGIAGFAAALDDLGDIAGEAARLAELRDRIEERCQAALPSLVIFGQGAARLPNSCCLALPGVSAQTLLMALDLADVAVSAGSACSSGKLGPSPVLLAMGQESLAGSAIRISLGWATSAPDVDAFIDRFLSVGARLSPGDCAA